MKIEKLNIMIFLLLALVSKGIQSQAAEYNKVNNWIYPTAQKYVGMDFINAVTGSLINNGTIFYSQNLINDGKVDFSTTLSANPALTQFIGTTQQHISGSGFTRFYSLQFANQLVAAAYSLEQDITVSHQIDFTKGIVKALQTTPEVTMNIVKLEAGAITTNASDISFVDGFVSKSGSTEFTFPIGNAGFYRPASISASTNATDCYLARYVYSNPDDAGYKRDQKSSTLSQISDKEYWLINRSSGTSNGQVTLTWDVTKTSATLPISLAGLSIARWDGTKWIDEGNVQTIGDETVGAITANVTGYGVFTIAKTNLLLPEFKKSSTQPVINNDGTLSWKYTLSLHNTTGNTLESIQINDNLDEVFKAKNCTYAVTSIIASGSFKSNGLYNGSGNVNTLVDGASLAVGGSDSIQIEVKVDTHGQTDQIIVYNQAVLTATVNSSKVSALSDDRTVSGTQDPTKTIIPAIVNLFVPDAFSPNGDGINDKFIIVHDVNTKVDLEVFNRDGGLVYKKSDYQNDWIGTGTNGWLGHELIDGTYFVSFKLIDKVTGKVVNKGVRYVTIRR